MPLGNSITQGNMEHPSYRYRLWQKLIDAEVDFEFVGSHSENQGGTPSLPAYKGKTYSNVNEGHWGWSADQILNGNREQPNKGELRKWLKQYKPDIVLMHLGTNDMFRNHDLEETVAELREVVRQIRAEAPQVTIMMAKLIPAYSQATGEQAANNIKRLNERIPLLVQELNNLQSPVILVDQNTGFDPTTGVDTWDGIHPNASGEEKMAQVWFEALANEIIVPLPVELHDFKGIATPSSVQLSWTTASEQDNDYFEVQRAQDTVDSAFTTIGKVKGAGTTSLTTRYTFEDKEAPAGISYYRLRQVDFSGEESYSAVVAVNVRQAEDATMRLYPTQTHNKPVTLRMEALKPKEKFRIALYTLEGRLIREMDVQADEQGNFSQLVQVDGLADAHLYLVKAILADRVFLRHLFVSR